MITTTIRAYIQCPVKCPAKSKNGCLCYFSLPQRQAKGPVKNGIWPLLRPNLAEEMVPIISVTSTFAAFNYQPGGRPSDGPSR